MRFAQGKNEAKGKKMGDFLREDAVPEGWITGELNPDQTRSDSLWGWAHSSPEWFHESKTASSG
jgi:hypothetical protein